MDLQKKEWKENSLGVLSALFLLAFILLFIPITGFSPLGFFRPLIWSFPLIGLVLSLLSCLKKEKNGPFFLTVNLAIIGFIALVLLVIPWETPPKYEPIDGASDTLKEALQTQYSPIQTQQRVTFKSEEYIHVRALVDKANVGITPEQACLSLGDYSEDTSFEGTTQMITYKGFLSRDVALSALCVPGEEMLSQVGEGSPNPEIKTEWASDCGCAKDPALAKNICCLVALRFPKE
jgi:hypothetical protein